MPSHTPVDTGARKKLQNRLRSPGLSNVRRRLPDMSPARDLDFSSDEDDCELEAVLGLKPEPSTPRKARHYSMDTTEETKGVEGLHVEENTTMRARRTSSGSRQLAGISEHKATYTSDSKTEFQARGVRWQADHVLSRSHNH